jgi:hypothetical protein
VGTPEGFVSEYYNYFIEKPPKNLKVIYGNTRDNAENLNEYYLELLGDAYDKKMQEAYIEGLWVNMADNLFYYSYSPPKNEDENLKPDFGQDFHCSMDFNVDPFCATLWQYNGWGIVGVDQVELKGGEGYDTKKLPKATRRTTQLFTRTQRAMRVQLKESPTTKFCVRLGILCG